MILLITATYGLSTVAIGLTHRRLHAGRLRQS